MRRGAQSGEVQGNLRIGDASAGPRAAFSEWSDPWEFADAPTASRRLREAGFVNVRTQVFPTPRVYTGAAQFREFIEHVICGPYLQRIPTSELRERFLNELVGRAAQGNPPFRLDYWRLNLSAEKA